RSPARSAPASPSCPLRATLAPRPHPPPPSPYTTLFRSAKFGGQVGVCMATSGPAAIHLLNGLYDAKLDHQPVVELRVVEAVQERSEEHTSELQSPDQLVCRLLLEKKKQ